MFNLNNNHTLAPLYRRFVLAFVLLGLALVSVSVFRGHLMQQRYIKQESSEIIERAQHRLNILLSEWYKDAQRNVNELTWLQDPTSTIEQQADTVTAFFAAQGDSNLFDAIVITDKQHQPIYQFGCLSAINHILNSQESLIRVHCPDQQGDKLYHVIELPIQLGSAEMGLAHFANQINASIMQDIAPSRGFARISQDQMPFAFSAGFPNEGIDDRLFIRTQLPWTESKQGLHAATTAEITLWRPLPPLEPWWMMILPPLIVVLFALTMIWLLLGRWMKQLSVRINLLWSGVQNYAISQDSTKTYPFLKVFQDKTQKDDVSRLGRAITRMINDVDSARERDHIFNETLALLEEAVISIDSDGNLIEASSGWLRLTRLATPTGERFLGYIHPEDREGWLLKSHQLMNSDKETIHVRFRLNTNQQATPWLEGRFLSHRNATGTITIRGALRDVTQSYLQEQQITHMALHDALTGLANRVLLEDRLKQSLLLCERNEQQLAVLFFDLDHFKQINDSLGHKLGDKLLIALGERISACLRASDTLARWGGDEFVILLPEIADNEEVRTLTDKLINAMQIPILIDENELPVSFSIGVAIYPSDAADIQALFSNADRAMFHAKSQGRNQACFYSDMDYKDNGKQELYIQNRLATAIKTKKITVHYQPIIACSSSKPHTVEALARWYDERYGWVSPATFVPMAENLGLICQLGELVFSQAFETLSQWLSQGHRLTMAINVSSRQLFSPSFIPGLLSELARHHLKAEHIILEVTESLALRDVDHAMERLQELQALGFLIAIDDFGTGHSSLAQLQEINADKLKIDRAFVMRIEDDKGHNMVKAVANMATALHLKTVAEGVETEAQKNLLCAMGVDYLQGFYFAKPMPADDCAMWIMRFNANNTNNTNNA